MISENRAARGLTGPQQLEKVNSFVHSLELNEYMPLEDWGANNRSNYISFEETTVKLGLCAIGRIGALGHNILKSAGRIVYDEE